MVGVVAAKVLDGTNAVADEVMLNKKAQALINPNCGRFMMLVSFGSSSTLFVLCTRRSDLNLIY